MATWFACRGRVTEGAPTQWLPMTAGLPPGGRARLETLAGDGASHVEAPLGTWAPSGEIETHVVTLTTVIVDGRSSQVSADVRMLLKFTPGT